MNKAAGEQIEILTLEVSSRGFPCVGTMEPDAGSEAASALLGLVAKSPPRPAPAPEVVQAVTTTTASTGALRVPDGHPLIRIAPVEPHLSTLLLGAGLYDASARATSAALSPAGAFAITVDKHHAITDVRVRTCVFIVP